MADPSVADHQRQVEPPPIVRHLVQRFHEQADVYGSPDYNETQLRRDFLDPLFEALGWDVANRQGYAEAYREVVHEDRIKVGGATKAPDYAFRIGGVRKFFVEAKKPAVDLRSDPAPAYQLRRYAWSAHLPLSILTDFEELAVYDCRLKPSLADKASVGRTLVLTCDEYLNRWGELAGLFSKEAILRGAFDAYAESTRAKRGTAEVDESFLADLESWREALAKHIALRNPGLSVQALNYAVQTTLDRVIFLRICEDRGIEPYGRLQSLLNGRNVYARLGELFLDADTRYDSGLFHFQAERGRAAAPDDWTLGLVIDDKPLKDIIKHLYYPDGPYEFSLIPADILGQVYERFLGKVIRLTPTGRAVVEEKPEVRKAGGVYYTPTYIVDYIVKNTVGRLLEGKTPAEVAELRILDPACGSGSFLLGAYECLLDWHLRWYTDHQPERHKKAVRPTSDGGWALTTEERKRILTANIYGVDIDPQAVEVTKLSLMLRVLEGETAETLGGQLRLMRERALPDLDRNIQCGNSLIGPEFYEGRQALLFDEETSRRINVFDWRQAFPEIMARGGFDVVIGNPPYIRIQALREWAPIEADFYRSRYRAASKGNYDIYVVFVERGLDLLRQGGRLGFILPHKFFNAQYGQPLRELLAAGKHLAEVVHFGDQQVFEQATTYTCLMFLDKSGSSECRVTKVTDLQAWRAAGEGTVGAIPAAMIGPAAWNFVIGSGSDLFERLKAMPVKLGDVAERVFQGLKTGADNVYIVRIVDRGPGQVGVVGRHHRRVYMLEHDLLHPLAKGGDIKRYSPPRTNLVILFPYAREGVDRANLLSEAQLRQRYPLTWRYLLDHRDVLERREGGAMRGRRWYGFSRSQALDVISLPKLITPDISQRASYSIDETGGIFFTGGVAGGYGIIVEDCRYRYYVMALLNSSVVDWCLRRQATAMRGGYFSYEARFMQGLPIRTIDFANPADVALHDQVVGLVEQMLALHRRLDEVRTAHDKALLQRQIELTDREIDRLVYELYELTDDEIAIVEQSR